MLSCIEPVGAAVRKDARELDDATKQFDQLNTQELPKVNDALKAKGQQPLAVVPGSSSAAALLAQYFDKSSEPRAASVETD